MNSMDYIFDFQLIIDGFSPDTFRLTYLDCQNDGLSQNYVFHVKGFSEQNIDISQWVLKKAVIYFHNKPFKYGVLSSGEAYEKEFEGYFYEFFVSSPLAALKTTGPNRVFVDKTVNDIIDDVLQTAGWSISQWRWDMHKTLPTLAYRVQYHQSDYDFIMQLFSDYQLDFIFDGEILKISDNLTEKNTTHHVESPQVYYSQEIAEFLGYDFEPAHKADLLTAKIESANPEEIDINHEGYYRIRFPFDEQSKIAEGSKPVPLLFPHFMHFPLKVGTEVAVRFLEGNINQPVLVGVIPEKDRDAEHYIHQSDLGHAVKFVPEELQLCHANQSNYIQFAENTMVVCEKGNITWHAQNDINFQIENNYDQNIQHDLAVWIKQHHNTVTKINSVFNAEKLISCSAEHEINLKTHNLKIQSCRGQCVSDDFQFESKGSVKIESSEIKMFSQNMMLQGNISLSVRGIGITGIAGVLMINTPVLQINAEQISGLVMATGI